MRGRGLSDTTKGKLRSTVGELREQLLEAVQREAERRYRFDVALEAPPDPTADDAGANRAWRDKADRALQAAGLRAGLRADRCVLDKHLAARAHAGVPRERALADAVAEAAATALQRLVVVRHLEATGLLPLKLLTGAERSDAYVEALAWMPSLVGRPDDPSKGFTALLDLLYAELARDLPGLFGDVGTTRLFPVPGATLLQVIEALDARELAPAWDDDTTVGWVYQFWNAAEKARIDAKVGEGDDGAGKGKVEAHEIAPKTALYTERYMVEWLLQNSLGPMWLAICARHGWNPDARAALDRLAAKRADDEVPIDDDLEDRWKYHVEAPLSAEFVAAAPDSVRSLKLLDPAVGSGHFLVAAFDWLFPIWQEEARHQGEVWTDAEIARGIVENNLHGIDIDPLAVRLAASAVWLKARLKGAHPQRLNLVAAQFELGRLSDDERLLAAERISAATPLDPDQVEKLLAALSRADVLGSLLDVDRFDERGIRELVSDAFVSNVAGHMEPRQRRMFDLHQPHYIKTAALTMLRSRLSGLSRTDDLGVRLGTEQVEAGLRFASMARSGQYDVVVANPPYLSTRRMDARPGCLASSPDIYAAFIDRAQSLIRRHGVVAMVAMSGWMYLAQFERTRRRVLADTAIRAVADLGNNAFSEITGHVTTVAMFAASLVGSESKRDNSPQVVPAPGTFLRITEPEKRHGLMLHSPRYVRDQAVFLEVAGAPLLYWWDPSFLVRYVGAPKLGDVAPVRIGLATSDNERFLRRPWEVFAVALGGWTEDAHWVPYIKGGGATEWVEPLSWVLNWRSRGLENKVCSEFINRSYTRSVRSEMLYFERGVAFSSTGNTLRARLHHYPSVFDVKGQSVFHEDPGLVVGLMNSKEGRFVLESLNPTVSFQAGDGARLPVWPATYGKMLYEVLRREFDAHQSTIEFSPTFRQPGCSAWTSVMGWAQQLVDGEIRHAVPESFPHSEVDSRDHLSFAVGQTLGRFPGRPVPGHILFVAARGLDNVDAAPALRAAWQAHGEGDLRRWLRERFFSGDHLDRYEKRPIHWPLSSKKRNFVAWVCIHTFTDDTLERVRNLIGDCLRPLEGELADLRAAPPTGKRARGKDPVAELAALVDELRAFDREVARLASEGPDVARQQVRAPFRMELDDGVRVNSAVLHPLLAPQWKDPAKWWNEIASGRGKKAAYWSRTAARYWPAKVAARCAEEPSHAVAHRCFWRLHPALAWKWELQLQDEIGPHYRHDEPDADVERTAWVTGFPEEALAGLVKEAERRRRKIGRDLPDPFVVAAQEPGIWEAIPDEVWHAELKLIKRWKRDVRLVDPDEPSARAAYVEDLPAELDDRGRLLEDVRPEQLELHSEREEQEDDRDDAVDEADAEDEA